MAAPSTWCRRCSIPWRASSYEATLWLNLAAPAGTPNEIIKRLADETARALQDPELQKNFHGAGVEASFMTGEPLTRFVQSEYDRWGRVVKQTGARIN